MLTGHRILKKKDVADFTPCKAFRGQHYGIRLALGSPLRGPLLP